MITEQEITALVLIVRRAPLTNMAEAESVSMLLDKIIKALRLVATPGRAVERQAPALPVNGGNGVDLAPPVQEP
jgi:hypothetical protein